MNIVIIYGKIASKIEFKFIYDRYKENDNIFLEGRIDGNMKIEVLNFNK